MNTRTLLGALCACLLAASPALAQTEIKFGHVGEPGSLFAQSAEEFARRANTKLGSKAKVVVYGSSQLGGDKELVQKLKLGTVDIALPSTVMTSEADIFGVFEMPYLVKDRKHMSRIEKEVFWPSIAPAAEKKGLKVIAVWENGYRHITNSKRPINTPEDLKGHVYTPAYATVGTKKWDSLPADVRKVLEDTAKETQAFVYELAEKGDKELLDKITAAGVKSNVPNKDAFVAASKPVYEEFAKEVAGSKEIIDRAIALGK